MSQKYPGCWPAHKIQKFSQYKFNCFDIGITPVWEWNRLAPQPLDLINDIISTIDNTNKKLYFESLKEKS